MRDVRVGLLQRVRRARLASQVIRRLRRAGLADARYDARGFRVRFTVDGDETPTILELAPLLATRGGRRRERVNRFVAGLVGTPRLPRAWADARPLLRPVLRGGTPGAPLRRPVLPFLFEFVVVDQPDTMTYVGPEHPARWEVSAEEVFAAAQANLSGAVLHGVADEPVVVRFVDDGDAYWTSHLLLPHWLERLAGQVGGAPVAFAPERGTLLVTADGSDHLSGLFAQAEEIYANSSRPITPMAYASDQHGCAVPYAAPPGHPLHHAVQRAERLLAVHEYARQAAHHALEPTPPPAGETAVGNATPADAALGTAGAGKAALRTAATADDAASTAGTVKAGAATGADAAGTAGIGKAAAETGTATVGMAELRLVGSTEQGWRTRAIWERDEPILLPAADEVQVGTEVCPWAELRRHLTKAPDLSPTRWAADRWPRSLQPASKNGR
jgi:hypothetical protein